MDPILWGPVFWSVLFEVGRNVQQNKDIDVCTFREWMYSLNWALPCSECRASFILILRHFPPPPKSFTNDQCLFYIWQVRDIVNRKLQRAESQCLTFEQFLIRSEIWDRFASSETVKTLLRIVIKHFSKDGVHVPSDVLFQIRKFIIMLPQLLPSECINEEVKRVINYFFLDCQKSNNTCIITKIPKEAKEWAFTIS